MLMLILLLVVGSLLAYLSNDNFTPVAVHIGPTVFTDIPLFYLIVGAMVTALVLAYLIYLIDAITVSFAMRAKDRELKNAKDDVLELTKRVHQLELDNEKLKHAPRLELEDRHAL